MTIYTPKEASTLFDINGVSLTHGTTYFRHPKQSETSTIIRSLEFHDFIMSQKIAEIIDYMRSELRLKSLSILVRSQDRKNVFVDGRLENLTPEIRAESNKRSQLYIDLKYNNSEKQIHRKNYIWLNDFPGVIAATRNAKRGSISFSQSTDMSFGLSAGATTVASFQIGWLSTFILEIEATFA